METITSTNDKNLISERISTIDFERLIDQRCKRCNAIGLDGFDVAHKKIIFCKCVHKNYNKLSSLTAIRIVFDEKYFENYMRKFLNNSKKGKINDRY